MPAYVPLMPAKGVIAGLVASWVKGLTEPRLQAVAEAILPPSPSQKQGTGLAWESTSHLVFGVALEAARSALGGEQVAQRCSPRGAAAADRGRR